ncbi:MAG: single-stranded DNA-binding protein [Spirochaetia bacterium]|nr:single-stranded DNA-binding protein [Spirochaetia bacterium]
MKNTNIVIVVGNLTGDAELKQTATGVSYIQFSIAVNKEQYNAETEAYDKKTDYLNNLAIFGKRAEAVAPLMKKGTKLLVQGSLHSNSYDKNGTTVKSLELKVENLEFLKFATTISDSDKEAVTEKIKVDANEPITEETLNFEIF